MSSDPRPGVLIYRDLLLPPLETYIRDQAGAMERYEPAFAGLRRMDGWTGPEPITPPHRSEGLRLALLRSSSSQFAARAAAARPSLIHAHFGPDGYHALPLGRRLSIPTIVTFHGYDVTMSALTSWRHLIWSVVRPAVFRGADLILAVSNFLRLELIRLGCPEEKIRVHYIGIDPAYWRRRTPPTTIPTVLFTGRLIEGKGCEWLLESMASVHRTHPDAELTVIGDGPRRSRLEARARDLGLRVRFLGIQPREVVRDHLDRATIFCVPPTRARSGATEALGLSFLEAQSMEVPVVSSNLGGVREAVDSGRTGILVPEGDRTALAAAIVRLLDDGELRRTMGAEGRRRIEAHFDLRQNTRALETIYDEVIERGRAR